MDHTSNQLDYVVFKKVLALAKPYKKLLYATILLAIFLSILGPLRPELIQRLLDSKILDQVNSSQLLVVALIIVLLLEALFRFLFIYASNELGQSIVKDLRLKVFRHIIGLNLNFYNKTPIGTLTTRTVNDIETINNIFTTGFIQLISDVFIVIIIVVWMLAKSWQLALISFITIPLLLIATYVFKESVKVAFTKVRKQVAELNAFLQEHISGMKIVQIFGVQDQEYKKFKEINKTYRSANIDAIWAYSIFFPVVEIILAIAIGLLIWIGAKQLIKNELYTTMGEPASIGLLVQFILLINMLFRPMRFMAERFNTIQMGLVAANRVFELLNKSDKIKDKGIIKDVDIKGDIEFKNVDFSYTPLLKTLDKISFKLPAGKMLAIVGSTGSGKSTIISLITRLYEYQKGDILLDNNKITDYDLAFYRSQFSAVLQDVFLFSGTVMENIKLMNKDILDEEVYKAAKLIGAHSFIMKLPNHYNYEVKERGATLSVGQRQLISFIRAMVYNPKVLILDEATSSVDTETEYLVQKAIETLIQGRTSIVIAHRLSTLKNADYILKIEGGTVIDYSKM